MTLQMDDLSLYLSPIGNNNKNKYMFKKKTILDGIVMEWVKLMPVILTYKWLFQLLLALLLIKLPANMLTGKVQEGDPSS